MAKMDQNASHESGVHGSVCYRCSLSWKQSIYVYLKFAHSCFTAETELIVRSLTGYFRRVILVQLEQNIPAAIIFATQMANEINYELSCLVEGDKAPFPVSISSTAYINVHVL